jgi:hypothetical protein
VRARRLRPENDHALSAQALAAMAEAARRSREARVGPELRPTPAAEPPMRSLPGERGVGGAGFPPGTQTRQTTGERRLRLAAGIAAVLLAVVLAAMVGTRPDGGNRASDRSTPTHASVDAPSTKPDTGSTGGSSGPGTTLPTSAPSSIAPPVPGVPPVLSTLEPSTGDAGQSVTVSGSNFLSPSGQITADVDGQAAPVACPSLETCSVVLPAVTGSPASAPVTSTTDTGTSNALLVTYAEVDDTGSCGCPAPDAHGADRRSPRSHPTRSARLRHQPPGR